MNLFIGIGKIVDVKLNGKVLKFGFVISQERPCYLSCLIFNPNDETAERIKQLQASKQTVWLQGKLSCSKLENPGITIIKTEVVTYAGSIRPI